MYKSKWDRVGIFASFACMLHCLLFPFILLALPYTISYFINSLYMEISLVLLSSIAATSVFYTGYQKHRRVPVLIIMILGLVLLISSFFFISRYEIMLKSLGACFLIVGHLQNWKWSKRYFVNQTINTYQRS
jgi:hypothetical protein